jgi:hypothetical protein
MVNACSTASKPLESDDEELYVGVIEFTVRVCVKVMLGVGVSVRLRLRERDAVNVPDAASGVMDCDSELVIESVDDCVNDAVEESAAEEVTLSESENAADGDTVNEPLGDKL